MAEVRSLHYALVSSCAQRMESLRAYRLSWWAHWARLAEFNNPRRYKWFISPNVSNRGSQINGQIVDETGVIAQRVLATGLQSNLTSPARPWFRLEVNGFDPNINGEVQNWLGECTNRMLAVYAKSNFYTMIGQAYGDLGLFGSSPLIQYEDEENVIHFYNPCMGEFFYWLDNKLRVAGLYREYTYTVQETVDEFGLDNCSLDVQKSYRQGSTSLDLELVICHAIEPNNNVYYSDTDYGIAVSPRFTHREVYWERAMTQGPSGVKDSAGCLRVKGFREKPFVGLRWDVTSNDAYGRSPGMDALPAVMQLQVQQRRLAEAIDKVVRPPMVGSLNMRNEPSNTAPGGITWSADPKADGFKPAYQVDPRVAELNASIEITQARVRTICFNDLFVRMMEEQKVQTATWVDAVQQEKLVLLGPVVERMENEGLDDIINRTFAIMQRRGLFPPPPPSIAGREITIQYISALALAQRAAATTAIERVWSFAGTIAGLTPDLMDNLDPDASIRLYADKLNCPPQILRALETVAAIRKQRSDEQAQAVALQTGDVLAKGAQTLSNTEVGGGQNALEMMLAS